MNFRIEGYGFMKQCTHPSRSCERRGKFDGILFRLANKFPNLRELDVSRSKIDRRNIRKLRGKLPNCEVRT